MIAGDSRGRSEQGRSESEQNKENLLSVWKNISVISQLLLLLCVSHNSPGLVYTAVYN